MSLKRCPRTKEKAAAARTAGADDVLIYGDRDFADAANQLTGGGPQGIGAVTNGPAAAAYAAPGWDQRFDYGGLDWGPPGPVIGVIGTGR